MAKCIFEKNCSWTARQWRGCSAVLLPSITLQKTCLTSLNGRKRFSMSRSKKVPETISGQILAIPRNVKRSEAFKACSPLARALLIELADQHNGANNGRLHLSYVYLREQGFRSKDQITKGRDELMARNLIILTRQGGLPIRNEGRTTFGGASWFALTWHRISNFVGLDISSSQYHPGAWARPCQLTNRPQPEALKAAQIKRRLQPAVQASSDPYCGAEQNGNDPYHGSIAPKSRHLTVP